MAGHSGEGNESHYVVKLNKRADLERRFRERYSIEATDAARAVEREVIGADFGANGYTTLRQAEMLVERLDLGPASLVLDVGSGRGWPGLFLTETAGCTVVLSDVPLPALSVARRRAIERSLTDRASIFRSSATDPPFVSRAFDAITHADAL